MPQNERPGDKRNRPASQVTGFDRVDEAEEGLPPEPGDLADRAQAASLDPDEGVNDVGGDQDIDTAATDADVNEQEPLEKRQRGNRERPQR